MYLATGRNGLAASEMMALHNVPLFAVNGMTISGGTIQFSGLALAPSGDAECVRFRTDDGISFTVEYPLPNPTAAEVYWYWPNSGRSAYRVSIDLAATRHDGEFYTFNLDFAGVASSDEEIRTTILIPKSIGLLENYPSGVSLTRVMRYNNLNNVAITGINDAWRMCVLARQYGWGGGGRVLDWGMGHGRIARHMKLFCEADIFGIDIDPENVAWAQSRIPHLVAAQVGPLMPPMNYESNTFDVVYGLSVMTHLAREVQEAWLEEISRVLRPGGLALLTFAGDASVAFASRYLDRSWVDTYLSTGRGPYLTDKSLVGVIETPDYYKNVKQTAEVAAEMCNQYVDVLGIHKSMFGFQDLLVLRAR